MDSRRRPALWIGALIGALWISACSTPPSTDPPEASTQTSGSSTTSLDPSTGSNTTGTSTDAAPDSTALTTNTTGPDPASTDDSGTTTDAPTIPGCPDPLPADWILCEDFELPGEPVTYFANFWTNNDLLAVEPTADTWSGTRALRIGHDPAIFSSGLADIRFGQGPPGGLVHAPDRELREVWVRFYLRTQAGWPDAGIAEAVEVMAVTGPARIIAMDATIYSPTQAQAQALAWSCVHDSQLLCDQGGIDDWGNPNLEVRDAGLGTTPLYGSRAAGQWQCHEVHVRLDDPGQANGQFEVTVDGQLEVSLSGIEFFDAWGDVGINNVRFSSFWSAPAALEHHIDDVVVATEPIGCPG